MFPDSELEKVDRRIREEIERLIRRMKYVQEGSETYKNMAESVATLRTAMEPKRVSEPSN